MNGIFLNDLSQYLNNKNINNISINDQSLHNNFKNQDAKSATLSTYILTPREFRSDSDSSSSTVYSDLSTENLNSGNSDSSNEQITDTVESQQCTIIQGTWVDNYQGQILSIGMSTRDEFFIMGVNSKTRMSQNVSGKCDHAVVTGSSRIQIDFSQFDHKHAVVKGSFDGKNTIQFENGHTWKRIKQVTFQ